MTTVQVAVRMRPMNEQEKAEGTLPVVAASSTQKCITVHKHGHGKNTGSGKGAAHKARTSFAFDHVFSSFATQHEVFHETLRPLIGDVLSGYEACVFAYGQTGTGKTHTMEGSLEESDKHGIIPRTAQAIFDTLASSRFTRSQVTCSYLEIYNDDLADLLADSKEDSPKITIASTTNDKHNTKNSTGSKNTASSRVECRGLSEHVAESCSDVLRLMKQAQQSRRISETQMNKLSSRSHCIFTMKVTCTQVLQTGDGSSSLQQSEGKLHLVDLAGSESAKTATLKGSTAREQAAREQERRSINKSLLTLGRVITCLKQKSRMIPYRESKLTRILQEALGGKCKTVLIATISPSVLNLNESLQTLHYAQTANGIENKPVVANAHKVSSPPRTPSRSPASSPSKRLHSASPSSRDSREERMHEMEIRLEHHEQEVEEARQALARNYARQQELEQLAGRLVSELESEQRTREALEQKLYKTEVALQRTTVVLKATQQTEESLTSEALALLQALKASMDDANVLYDMVQASRDKDTRMKQGTRDFVGSVAEKLKSALDILDQVVGHTTKTRDNMGKLIGSELDEQKMAMEAVREVVSELSTSVVNLSSSLVSHMSDGVIPNVQKLSETVTARADELQSISALGDEQLASSCQHASLQLGTFGHELGEMEVDHSKMVRDSMAAIETAILGTKQRVESMVHDAGVKIQEVRDRSFDTREAFSHVLKEWSDTTLSATNQVNEIAQTQRNTLRQAYDTLETEARCYNAIDNELVSQVGILDETRYSQFTTLTSQSEQLDLQINELNAVREAHKDLCKNAVARVMDGVHALVTEQLDRVMSEQSKQVSQMEARSREALSLNKDLGSVTDGLLRKIANTNDNIRNHSRALRSADAIVLDALGREQGALGKVLRITEDHQNAKEGFSSDVAVTLRNLERADADIGTVGKSLTCAGQVCVDRIEADVQSVANESVSRIGEKGRNVVSFVQNEVLTKASEAIVNVQEPREHLSEQLRQKLAEIRESARSGAANIKAATEQQITTLSTASTRVSQAADEFTMSTCSKQRDRTERMHAEMSGLLDSSTEDLHILISKCKGNISQADTSTAEFGHSFVDMDAVVPDAPPKTTIQYNHELSATPDDETILRESEHPARYVAPIKN